MAAPRRAATASLLVLGALGVACAPPAAPAMFEDPRTPFAWQPGQWSVVWQDEFDGPAGTPPDSARWTHQVGGDGWGNKELQDYTDSPDNAALDGAGNLLITARAQPTGANAYTSARLTTDGLFSHLYGRFEARLKLVNGQGLWPAFWLLGDDFDTVGWPSSGEIDIVEQNGANVMTVSGSVHGPELFAPIDVPSTGFLPVPGGDDDGFHVYAVEWDPDSVVFLVDDTPYFKITPARRSSAAKWVFDHPFFIILNLAVGGLFPGAPNATTPLPQALTVDYVRVSDRVGDGGIAADAATPDSDAATDDAATDDDAEN
jgi:beta-glucanase (GH16 family)